MQKSDERNVEYIVVARPFYREHPPVAYIGYAQNKEEAMMAIWESSKYKEILDCKISSELDWNTETALAYWKQYSDSIDEKRIYLEKQLF